MILNDDKFLHLESIIEANVLLYHEHSYLDTCYNNNPLERLLDHAAETLKGDQFIYKQRPYLYTKMKTNAELNEYWMEISAIINCIDEITKNYLLMLYDHCKKTTSEAEWSLDQGHAWDYELSEEDLTLRKLQIGF